MIGILQGQDDAMPYEEGEVELIKPIFETEPLNDAQVKSYLRSSKYRNWGIDATGIGAIKETYSGKGARVCICDDGIPQHKDSKDKVKLSHNATDEANTRGSHVEHVFGISLEVAPDAEYYFSKVLRASGSGSTIDVAEGIRWCANQNVHAINLSLGSRVRSPSVEAAVKYAVDKGIYVVCAAGNDGTGDNDNIGHPARMDEVYAIGATNKSTQVAYFSSSGPEGDIVAPGQDIMSNWVNDTYRSISGTSMSAPFVAGVIALLVEMQGGDVIPVGDLETRLEATTFDIAPDGFDRYSFFGIITPDLFSQNPDNPVDDPPVVDDPGKRRFNWLWIGVAILGIVIVFSVVRMLNS